MEEIERQVAETDVVMGQGRCVHLRICDLGFCHCMKDVSATELCKTGDGFWCREYRGES